MKDLVMEWNPLQFATRKFVSLEDDLMQKMEERADFAGSASNIPDIIDATAAIILTHMSAESDDYLLNCENASKKSQSDRLSITTVHKKAIVMYESAFLVLRQLVTKLAQSVLAKPDEASLYTKASLLASIKLLKAHLLGIDYCKANITDFVDSSEVDTLVKLAETELT